MSAVNDVTELSREGEIAVIAVNSPPVNALSAKVRDGLAEAFRQAVADPQAHAIVLICEGKTFIAGADITEFGKPPRGISLLDLENIIEELESMARAERREFKHRIEQLIMHQLKCKLQPDHISGSWLSTITEQRHSITDLMEEMPSLKPQLDAYITRSYAHAVARAADETHLPKSAFPATMPFTKDQLLDPDYLP